MQYLKFRALGLFVGSGVIEAGCKTVIGSRLKQSGMFWTVRGANSIIALRCNHFSGKSKTTGAIALSPPNLSTELSRTQLLPRDDEERG